MNLPLTDCGVTCGPLAAPAVALAVPQVGATRFVCFKRAADAGAGLPSEYGTLTYDVDAAGTVTNEVLTDAASAVVGAPWVLAPCPLDVKIVGTVATSNPAVDRETVIACNAVGQRILVQYDVTTVPPTELARTNLFTNAAEPPGALVPCAVGSDIEQTEGCAAGVPSTRVRVFNPTTGALVSQTFLDAAGGVLAAPAGWTPGACSAGAGVDRSGAIAVGDTAQVLMAANPARRGILLQNDGMSDLFLNELGAASATAGSSLRVPAGALLEWPQPYIPTTAISIVGATAGQKFMAREY